MYSKTILVGRLGKDPESRSTTSGTSVVTLSLATESRYKNNSGEWESKSEWHRVTIFGNRGNFIAERAKKGSLIFVEGKNQTRNYDKDGTKHYVTEVVADEVKLLDGKSEGSDRPDSGRPQTQSRGSNQPRQQQKTQSRPVTQSDPITDDDIPF